MVIQGNETVMKNVLIWSLIVLNEYVVVSTTTTLAYLFMQISTSIQNWMAIENFCAWAGPDFYYILKILNS